MIDLLIVLAFVAYAVTMGFRARRQASKNLKEYFLAGKQVKGWRAGISMAATQFAADTPLLVIGLVATGGIFLVWRLWVYGLSFLLLGILFASLWRRSNVLTDAELTEVRYSGGGVLTLRVLKAIYYGTIINCVVLAMVLLAAMRIGEVFLPWHEWLAGGFYDLLIMSVEWIGLSFGESPTGLSEAVATTNHLITILLIMGVTLLYSATGGLRGVISTDLVQFLLAMVGTLAYAIFIVYEVGGLAAMRDQLVELYSLEKAHQILSFAPRGQDLLFPFLMIIGLQWFFQMNSDGTGYLAQRAMACKTDRDARIAAVVFSWAQIVLRSVLWLIIAVGLLVLYPFELGVDRANEGWIAGRELIFVQGIDELLPVGLLGLMLTGLLAALASTIDTHLNWGASYWSNDIYKRLLCEKFLGRKPNSRELVLVARLSNVLLLLIALVVMAQMGAIQTAWTISILFGAGMGSVLILRWLWERINWQSEVAAMISSIVVAPLLLIFTEEEWVRLSSMALVSTLAAVGITFVTPKTKTQNLQQFYRRVQPLGFWTETSVSLNRDPSEPVKRLGRAIKITALCGASLFLSLIGLSKLFIPTPGQGFGVGFVYLGISIAVAFWWWKDVFQKDDSPERENPSL